jgi:hypothetical protein
LFKHYSGGNIVVLEKNNDGSIGEVQTSGAFGKGSNAKRQRTTPIWFIFSRQKVCSVY